MLMNIILSPHFDDAVLSLGGLLAQEGGDTLVATFFAGMPQTPLVCRWDKKCDFADSTEAMQARAEENKKSLNFFGVSDDRIRNYGHLDVEYRVAGGEPKISEPGLENLIRREIEFLITEFASSPLKIFVPGLERHADHALVKRAVLALAQTVSAKDSVQFLLYQDLPYALKIGDKELSVTNGSFAVSAHSISLTEAEMEKKLAGIALYVSQVPHLGKGVAEQIKQFAADQAPPSTPYCEMVYAFLQNAA